MKIAIEIVPQLARLFPGSYFIYLCRDGRDVAKSFQRTGWYGPWLHDNTREWNEAVRWRERWKHFARGSQILDVHYEELVLNFEPTIRAVCEFMGERFEPQMLAWQSRVDELVPAREIRLHERLKRTPALEDVSRWRREMTTRELFVSEAFIGKQLEHAGYDRKFGSRLWAPVLLLTRCYCAVMSAVDRYPLRILRALRRRYPGRWADLGGAGGRQ